MTHKKSFKDIADSIREGRTISSVYARKTVKMFFARSVDQVLKDLSDQGDAAEYAQMFQDTLNPDGIKRNIGDSLDHYRDLVQHPPMLTADALAVLSFPGAFRKASEINPVFSLPVEEYLEMAGRKDWYDKWFASDAKAWMKEHSGRVPVISDVLRNCFLAFEKAPDHIFYYSPDSIPGLVLPEKIAEPFRRHADGICEFPETNLAATWVYILMLEVPHLLIANGILSDNGKA